MVAAVTVFTNNIVDVNLNGVAPVVQAENLCVLRRHDPDDPTDGLTLYLALLDPAVATMIEGGLIQAAISNRTGTGPDSPSSFQLGADAPRHAATLARLLSSATVTQLISTGGAADFAGDVGVLPAGLTLQSVIPVDTVPHEIAFSNANAIWKFWGASFGQDFSDQFDVEFVWRPT